LVLISGAPHPGDGRPVPASGAFAPLISGSLSLHVADIGARFKNICCGAIKSVDDPKSNRYRRVRLLQCTNAQEPQMSVIERSQSFVKEMNELNVNAITKYFEIQREAIEQFVGANRARFTALREMKGLEDLVTAQREYYAAVQKNVADSVKKQADLVRENFTTSGKLVRELFNRETTEA
jgi:hypothetical protein